MTTKFFTTADDKPIPINYKEALNTANIKLKIQEDDTKDPDELIGDLYTGKRKRKPGSGSKVGSKAVLQPAKRIKQNEQKNLNSSTCIISPTKQSDLDEESDDINWSDDENFDRSFLLESAKSIKPLKLSNLDDDDGSRDSIKWSDDEEFGKNVSVILTDRDLNDQS